MVDFTFASQVLNRLIAFVIALIANEVAQGYMARYQGDDTPEHNGRLTFNPIPHMDPIGSVVLPLIGAVLGGFMIGYPKPMPINTSNMRNSKWGPVITALAGPGANLLLSSFAMACLILIGSAEDGTPMIAIFRILKEMTFICAIWAVFQLIPIPPLAGAEIVSALLPHELRVKYESLAQYSMIIFLVLIFSGAFRVIGVVALVWMGISHMVLTSLLN